MAFKKIGIGGTAFGFVADSRGLAITLSYNGRFWDRMVRFIRKRRASKRLRADNAEISASTVQKPVVTNSQQAQSQLTIPKIEELKQSVESTYWYHSFDFGNGILTNGRFDHAPIIDRYQLPKSLSGKRVLDVATFDGFWAFELEKRGAREVVAIDVEGPAACDFLPERLAVATEEELSVKFGIGFEIAKKQFDSRVERVVCSVYDLTPEKFGLFDVVHMGDLLPHLNSPIKALQNVASVCTEYAIISEGYFPSLDIGGARGYVEYLGGHADVSWWRVGFSALERMITDAGFKRVELIGDFRYGPRGMAETMHHAVFKAYV